MRYDDVVMELLWMLICDAACELDTLQKTSFIYTQKMLSKVPKGPFFAAVVVVEKWFNEYHDKKKE